MKRDGEGIRLSASDLKRFTACPHASRLDLAYLQGEDLEPVEDSEGTELLQERGQRHEAEYLSRLESEGKTVVRVETENVSLEESVDATCKALAAGPDIVYQGALAGGVWGGYADFLERVPVPSKLGSFSYEVTDTKLKRKPAPDHVLQLALYSDLLSEVQGHAPECAHIQLGSGERTTLRLAEYSDYARFVRTRFEAFVQAPPPTRPVPCPFCDLCRWREHCAEEWRKTDSLYQIAGIRRSQAGKLEATGIRTMEALARHEGEVPELADETAEKLREQAQLQHARKTGEPSFKLRPSALGKGFDLMPRPDPGDLFYDIEGDPYYAEAGLDGLEYLHGIWDGRAFAALWAHDRVEEKKALESLLRRFEEHFARHPGAHVYHYAPYERTALRQLAMRHGLGEVQLDCWLRERRFVDLYAVVRGGIFASEPSYSLKDLEIFYDLDRDGAVASAGDSIVAYEKWRETGEAEVLAAIEDYNRLDCISLAKLRDWLLGIRAEGSWPEAGEGETPRSAGEQEENENLADLLAASGLPEERRRLLYDLGVFHWREKKPQAWAVFDAAEKDFEELCDDMECLAGLVASGRAGAGGREYRYPPQETKLRAGKSALFARQDGFASAKINELDRHRRKICLNPSRGAPLPDRMDILPEFALNPGPIPAAIRRVAEDQCGSRRNQAAEDVLSRNPPRFRGPSPLPLDESVGALQGLIKATRILDRSVLPVQGPPGTGKTYVAARAILALVRDGRRIAVSSNSHEAIRNVLAECARALCEEDAGLAVGDVKIAHKVSSQGDLSQEYKEAVSCVTSNQAAALHSAQVVGGTAWLFSRDEHRSAFDCLFIDEAGQVPLANLIAMSNAAANLVLIGDPRQLPQVTQGAHPHPANLSCLDWMLGEGRNVDPEHGIFLPETRRMHPDLCSYISAQFYEGRLRNHPSTELQSVEVSGLPSAGAWRVPVVHEGRAQISPEEVEAVRETIGRLLAGAWTDRNGNRRPFRESDIIVVAPYNAQVNALSDALPGIRVGTVDKFQGQEAPVALVSMTASTAEETSRGLSFLLSRERLNVAVSRGQGLSLVFASPQLLHANCATAEQVRLVNALCALPEAIPLEE
ncbi:MAG: TM0106 family RecB-like putative nuclease [Gammaproteobacteria bacterium]|nr:TM0106 family RecB-like putative nuclease [Gammaproteobacteria bacterium]